MTDSGIAVVTQEQVWGHATGQAAVMLLSGSLLLVPRTFLLSPAKVFFGMDLPVVIAAHVFLVSLGRWGGECVRAPL